MAFTSKKTSTLILIPLALSFFFSSLLPFSSAGDTCPSFANQKAACGVSTCGHFVYKGSFSAASSRQHLLSASVSDGKKISSPAACCQICRQANDCAYWSFTAVTGKCELYKKELCALEGVYEPSTAHSYVGGFCGEPSTESVDATKVSTEELLKPIEEKPFCLVSDKQLHINMLLGGYNDLRSSTPKIGQTTRSWIRELAILWKTSSGKTHTLHFEARRGPKSERGDGFLQHIKVDGTEVPRLTLGDELSLFDGEAIVSFDAYEKAGVSDVDVFKVQIPGLLDVELRVRAAHPFLQLEDDAEVHISMDLLELEYSNSIHGVLGQSYRSDRSEQNVNYATLTNLIHASPEDKDSYSDSLQGIAANYLSSSVMSPDCDYTQFSEQLSVLEKAFKEAADKTRETSEQSLKNKESVKISDEADVLDEDEDESVTTEEEKFVETSLEDKTVGISVAEEDKTASEDKTVTEEDKSVEATEIESVEKTVELSNEDEETETVTETAVGEDTEGETVEVATS